MLLKALVALFPLAGWAAGAAVQREVLRADGAP